MQPISGPKAIGLLTLAIAVGQYAIADDAGWYAGFNAGQSRAKIDEARINSDLLGSGYTSTLIDSDNRSTGYKLFGGYQFSPYFAMEGGYFDLGKFGYTATTVPAGTLSGEIKLRGLNLDLVGLLPFTDRFAAFGRLGATSIRAKDRFSGTGSVVVLNPTPSKRDTLYKFGLGLQYAFTDSLGMRTELERYRINDAVGNRGDIDLISVGLLYRFGGKAPAPAAPIRQPEPVYVAPSPPPPVVMQRPPVPPPTPQKVSFSADSLFDFDKSTVKPEGKQALDKFSDGLKGNKLGIITVVGHTDRIGSHTYNQALSTRRAEAVKAHLVNSAGIPGDRIDARGVDGAEPVTKPDECPGLKKTRKLIICLQPDRRVEVTVSGTE
ncbi:OmpA family protein [Chitinimonas arctica]|uniref:OmpA family protein n=1 Tax=Chitinimonas arctica TaxID=2594795 RepID=A0A516SBR6_9NEIS|nr:OmpA family protein [Chitinimonas arctica]QDQ25508.1 OmpA family protein [Chitinimonas arctica]